MNPQSIVVRKSSGSVIYYMSHEHINSGRIVPLGPLTDFMRPHGRERLDRPQD